MMCLMFANIYNCYSFLIDILPKNIAVRTSIRPYIRYPALNGYRVSGFWISRISGRPDIRQKQYPVHPYFFRIWMWIQPKLTDYLFRIRIHITDSNYLMSVPIPCLVPVPNDTPTNEGHTIVEGDPVAR
jgi:hypothetical protein